MNSGRCGSLLLHRNGLAPSALCRSPGAPDSGRSRCSHRTVEVTPKKTLAPRLHEAGAYWGFPGQHSKERRQDKPQGWLAISITRGPLIWISQRGGSPLARPPTPPPIAVMIHTRAAKSVARAHGDRAYVVSLRTNPNFPVRFRHSMMTASQFDLVTDRSSDGASHVSPGIQNRNRRLHPG